MEPVGLCARRSVIYWLIAIMNTQISANGTSIPASKAYGQLRERQGIQYEPLGTARTILVIVYVVVTPVLTDVTTVS